MADPTTSAAGAAPQGETSHLQQALARITEVLNVHVPADAPNREALINEFQQLTTASIAELDQYKS
ncbi:MAG: hypothetical protein NTV69_16105, partial [Caldilinea sp.]|nr:hypothetical protein [Caldilinea sp.]